MFDFVIKIAHYLPFLSFAVLKNGEIDVGAIISRLLEYGIIAGFLMWTNVQVMDTKLAYFNKEIEEMKLSQKSLVVEVKATQLQLERIKTILERIK